MALWGVQMVYWFSVFIFIVLAYALGYSLESLGFMIFSLSRKRKHAGEVGKDKADLFERLVMRIGFGICFLIVLFYLFGMIGLPLNVYYFLGLSLVVPLYRAFMIYRKEGGLDIKSAVRESTKLKKKHIVYILLLAIFAVTLFMYMKGSFAYPYFEDGDPYGYGSAAHYVQERQTFWHVSEAYFHYLPPYPPAYSTVMGLVLQTNDDMVWTMKFFNALILSLSVLWFFFLAYALTRNRWHSLFATFVLAALPGYLSHFIFSHALGTSLFAVGLYALVKAKDERRWLLPLIVSVAAILMIQAVVSVVFGLFSIVMLIGYCIQKRGIHWRLFLGLLLGLVASLALFWGPNFLIFGEDIVTSHGGEPLWAIGLAKDSNQFTFGVNDFLFSRKVNGRYVGGIDTQSGTGIVVVLLALFGLAYLVISLVISKKARSAIFKKEIWILISAGLLLLAFLGLQGGRLPVRMFPLRWWAFFSIAIALFSAYSISRLVSLFKSREARFVVVIVLVIGVAFTSFHPRYVVQTSMWPPHQWTNMEELQGYMQLGATQYDSFFPVCSGDDDWKVSFIGKESWIDKPRENDVSYFRFKETVFDESPAGLVSFMRSHNLDYILVDAECTKEYGINKTNGKVNELIGSGSFQGVFQAPGVILLGIV